MKKTGTNKKEALKEFEKWEEDKAKWKEEVMKLNKEWIEEMKKEGKTIVDIGIDKTRSNRSEFYKMEQESTKNYGKQKEIKIK